MRTCLAILPDFRQGKIQNENKSGKFHQITNGAKIQNECESGKSHQITDSAEYKMKEDKINVIFLTFTPG